MFESLYKRIEDKTAKVGVIGLGYVGLPLVTTIAKAGFQVTGIDISEERVDQVQRGISYISDLPSESLYPLVQRGQIQATTDSNVLSEISIIHICVPTPLGKNRNPDISNVLTAVGAVAKHLYPGQLIILESTTYPGTTEEVVLPQLENTGLEVGKDFFLAFSPERIDPGNTVFSIENTPKIVGGVTELCTKITEYFYSLFINKVHPVSSPKTAETTKLLENTFRNVNIALVNEFAQMCNGMELNVWEIIEAAATKPFGYMPFYPGPGLGGHCIPIDPHYLAWSAKHHDIDARFIELASEINESMPEYIVSKVTETLNQHFKPVNGSTILVLGVAYKRDVSDTRESPAIPIIQLLQEQGGKIAYHDPHVPQLPVEGNRYISQELTAELLQESDCVVVITDHSDIDYKFVLDYAQIIYDTRNIIKSNASAEKIIKL